MSSVVINKMACAETLPKESKASARERILETAMRLFYQDGIRATGIDKIIAESGVAKMSFYRSFPSKSDLVVAFLRKRHDLWMSWFTQRVEAKLASSNGGLEVIADVLKEWFEEPDFRGCAFINTVAEDGSHSSEQASIAQDHKQQLEDYLEKLARRLKLKVPKEVAAAATLVIDGTIVRAQMTGNPRVALVCKQLLKKL